MLQQLHACTAMGVASQVLGRLIGKRPRQSATTVSQSERSSSTKGCAPLTSPYLSSSPGNLKGEIKAFWGTQSPT